MAIKNLGATLEVTPDGGSLTPLSAVTGINIKFVMDEREDATSLANSTGYRDYVGTFLGVETMTVNGEWSASEIDVLEGLKNASVAPTWTVTLSDGAVIAGDGRLTKLSLSAGSYTDTIKFTAQIEGTGSAWTIA